MAAHEAQQRQDLMQQVFAAFDTDGSGFVDRQVRPLSHPVKHPSSRWGTSHNASAQELQALGEARQALGHKDRNWTAEKNEASC